MTCLYLMDNLHSTLHWKQWSYGPQFRSYATLHFVCGFVAEADGAQWTGPAACRCGAQGGRLAFYPIGLRACGKQSFGLADLYVEIQFNFSFYEQFACYSLS